MRRLVYVGFAIVLVVAVAALGIWLTSPNGHNGTGTVYSLRQEWIPQMTFTGEIVASRKAFFGPAFQLEIKPGGLETDPIKLVASGVDTFGVAGAERVLKANEEGASLVVIGVVNPRSPSVFLVKADSPIQTPKDFEGRTVGVLSGSNTEIAYLALIAKAGVDRSKIREKEISYDIPGFIKGAFDVLPAFAYDEPLTLRKENVAFRTIDPAAADVQLIGNVYFTTRKMAADHPEVVRQFLEGVRRGWTYAFENPEEAIALLGEVDSNLDLPKEKDSLMIARSYFQPKGYQLLEIRREDWEDEVRVLRSIDYLKKPVNLDEVVNTQFLKEPTR